MIKSSPDNQAMRISSPDIQVIVKASHAIQKASSVERKEMKRQTVVIESKNLNTVAAKLRTIEIMSNRP